MIVLESGIMAQDERACEKDKNVHKQRFTAKPFFFFKF